MMSAGVVSTVALSATPASASSTICATPCTLFGATVPPIPDSGPDNAVELGVKFTASVAGSVTGVRFYKGVGNTGPHTGTLWTAGGSPLATATFTGETASGWQEVTFASPVAVTAGTTYVASYHTTVGHYAFTLNGFTSAFDNPPLHAQADGAPDGNGVYSYDPPSGLGGFPNNTFNAANYWVDVLFVTAAPSAPTVTTVTSAGPSSVSVAFTPGSDGGNPITSYTATCVSLNGQPSGSASGPAGPIVVSGLTGNQPYQCTVTETNAAGTSDPSAPSNVIWPGASTINDCPPGSSLSAPASLTTAPGDASAVVSWAPSVPTGCVAGYVVTPYVGSVPQLATVIPGHGTTTVIKGLANGQTYQFTVAAENGHAAGPASPLSKATTVGAPKASASLQVAKVAKGSLEVAFAVPANNGSAITKYTATCASKNGGVTKAKSGKTGPLTVSGLTPGKTYTCTVRASNRRGTGPASAASKATKA